MSTVRVAIASRVVVPAAASAARGGAAPPAATGRTHMGPVARLIDRVTRRWLVELYDVDLQLESADIDADLHYGQR